MSEWDFLREFVDLGEVVGDPGARWQAHAIWFLEQRVPFAIDMKSRKIAWSLTAAAWAYAKVAIDGGRSVHFVSYNKLEAAERIRDAKSFYHATRGEFRSKLLNDSALFMELANGGRIVSHSVVALRGLRDNVVADEVAFWENAEQRVTEDLMPVATLRGEIRMGSTMGESGDLVDRMIRNENRQWGRWRRRRLPWWSSELLCSDLGACRALGSDVTREERLERYGTERLKVIADAMPLSAFLREYECEGSVGLRNWIDLQALLRCQHEEGEVVWRGKEYRCGMPVTVATATADLIAFFSSFRGEEVTFYGGYDVGRTRHSSSLSVVVGIGEEYYVGVLGWFHGLSFEDQETILHELLRGPVNYLVMDKQGIGYQLCETLEAKYPGRVEGVALTGMGGATLRCAGRVQAVVDRHEIHLPRDMRVVNDFRSVMQKGRMIETRERSDGGLVYHGDSFWATALALEAHAIGGGRWTPGGSAVVSTRQGRNERERAQFRASNRILRKWVPDYKDSEEWGGN